MFKQIKDSFRELFLFLKNPVDKPDSNQTLREKSLKLFLVLIIDLVIAGICVLLLSILQKQGLFSSENHKIIELLKSMPKGAVIIALIIIVPIVEELIFRLYLRYKNNYLLRFFISLFYITGKNRKELIEKRIKKLWYKKYGYIFYFSAILFGFVHIFNFDSDKNLLLLFPIITAPQIFAGLFAGYLRVRFNLIWGFFLHAIHNLVFFLPFLIIGDSIELLNTDTNDYSLKIEEVFQSDKEQIAKYFSDSVYFQNYKLKDIIAYTSYMDSWLIVGNNIDKMNKKLNIGFKNKIDSILIDRSIIENELTDLYNFKIEKEYRIDSVWTVFIEDSSKLNRYKTDSINGNYWRYSNDSASIFRVNLAGIALALQNSKKKKVFLKDNIAGRFNIRLNTKDTRDLRIKLDSIYGLKLGDSLATVEYLNIDFETKE
jgi:membrane protease YdiL (CAAX protease family)